MRALLALVLARPVKRVSFRKLDLGVNLLHGFLHRASQIAAAYAVLDRHVTLAALAVDFFGSVPYLDFAELSQRDALAARRHQPDVLDRFLGIAVLRQVTHHQIVTLLALQDLAHGISAHRGLNRVLHVGYVDSVAGGFRPVHGEIQIRLSDHPEQAQVLDSWDRTHDVDDLLRGRLQGSQVGSEKLQCEFSFYAAYRFLHVVGDRLRKIPEDAGNLVQLPLHCAYKCFFVLVKNRAPLLLGFQIHEKLGVKEAGCVRAIVRPSHLAGALGNFRKRAQQNARLVRHFSAPGLSGAGRERASHPNGSLVQMGQELRSDGTAQQHRSGQNRHRDARRRPPPSDSQAQGAIVHARQNAH